MRTRKQDLQNLKRVTEAVWLAASQELRAKAEAERTAASKLAGLAADRRRTVQLLAENGVAGAQVAAAARWMRWSDAERARLNMELARRRAELAREQDAARTAFARDQAMEKILKRVAMAKPAR